MFFIILCDCQINFYIASSNVSMKFRNYLPHDKQLQEGKLAPPVLPKFEDPVLVAPPQEEKKEVLHEFYHIFLLAA